MQKINADEIEIVRLVVRDYPNRTSRIRLSIELIGLSSELYDVSALIEQNADQIRSKYLAWVFELGQISILGKPIYELLKLDHRVNLWEMSTLAEKSIWKTPEILDALQIIVLQEHIYRLKPSIIEIHSSNSKLLEIVSATCIKIGSEFREHSNQKLHHRISVAKSSELSTLNSIIELLKFRIRRLPFRFLRNSKLNKNSTSHFLLTSYFDNYSLNISGGANSFTSNYFGNLPEEIIRAGKRNSWLHIFPNSDSISQNIRNVHILNKLNSQNSLTQQHFALEKFVSTRLLMRAFSLWRKISSNNSEISKAIEFTSSDGVWLAPLFRNHWADSISGRTALRNIIWSLLFEKFFSNAPDFSTCVYLQENQSWEVALINEWNHFSNGTVIGFPHASVRFWDLRYFYDFRQFTVPLKTPVYPDFTVANGNYAQIQLIDGNIPRDKIVLAEGLRYLQQNSISRNIQTLKFEVLVIGEYDFSYMSEFSTWLSRQPFLLQEDLTITVKPHPNHSLDSADFYPLRVEFSNRSLAEMLPEVDLVIAGGMTSAAVDAYIASIPLLTFQTSGDVNLGPLRGIEVVTCSSNSVIDLDLINTAKAFAANKNTDQYFFRDKDIPRWRHLLKLEE